MPMTNYSNSASREEFYLAGTEREMLRRIGDIMKRQGYVAVADLDGRTHFFLDPQSNAYQAVRTIEKVHRDIKVRKGTYSKEDLWKQQQIAEEILRSYGFNMNLSGSKLISEAVLLLNEDYRLIKPIAKGLYARLALQENADAKQIERNIRYAVASSALSESNSAAINRVFNEFRISLDRRMQQEMQQDDQMSAKDSARPIA